MMTVKRAIELLNDYGSDHDPVIFRGKEIAAYEIAYLDRDGKGSFEAWRRNASDIRIGYWAIRRGRFKFIKRGTLSGMVRDRSVLRDPKPLRGRLTARCGHCGGTGKICV